MKGYKVDKNILDYLFVKYPCFNEQCSGEIIISLSNLYRSTRTLCPVCRKECSLSFNRVLFEAFQRDFESLYRQLHELRLLPLVFSSEVSPKTVFLNSMEQDKASHKHYQKSSH